MKQCLILTLAVASGPLGCLHLQRMEAGKHRICSICINHLIIFLIILNPHHSQCQQIILIPLQVKGKGEMMTYYVDLTDDLFLVEKRRHGEEEEEGEGEGEWEKQRFYCNAELDVNKTCLWLCFVFKMIQLKVCVCTHYDTYDMSSILYPT